MNAYLIAQIFPETFWGWSSLVVALCIALIVLGVAALLFWPIRIYSDACQTPEEVRKRKILRDPALGKRRFRLEGEGIAREFMLEEIRKIDSLAADGFCEATTQILFVAFLSLDFFPFDGLERYLKDKVGYCPSRDYFLKELGLEPETPPEGDESVQRYVEELAQRHADSDGGLDVGDGKSGLGLIIPEKKDEVYGPVDHDSDDGDSDLDEDVVYGPIEDYEGEDVLILDKDGHLKSKDEGDDGEPDIISIEKHRPDVVQPPKYKCLPDVIKIRDGSPDLRGGIVGAPASTKGGVSTSSGSWGVIMGRPLPPEGGMPTSRSGEKYHLVGEPECLADYAERSGLPGESGEGDGDPLKIFLDSLVNSGHFEDTEDDLVEKSREFILGQLKIEFPEFTGTLEKLPYYFLMRVFVVADPENFGLLRDQMIEEIGGFPSFDKVFPDGVSEVSRSDLTLILQEAKERMEQGSDGDGRNSGRFRSGPVKFAEGTLDLGSKAADEYSGSDEKPDVDSSGGGTETGNVPPMS